LGCIGDLPPDLEQRYSTKIRYESQGKGGKGWEEKSINWPRHGARRGKMEDGAISPDYSTSSSCFQFDLRGGVLQLRRVTRASDTKLVSSPEVAQREVPAHQ
ncbi:hypothetical protein ACRALDRAFT_210668, partial [Sodiomyces alcalophilus JCM 7366]|uniref:uncharacterized protein n=1 Tax=Sodiomyces alcalophilus JCM 7366 TaxID=591952 RepID=UPI0039B5351A